MSILHRHWPWQLHQQLPAGQALVAQHCAIDNQLSCHMEVRHLVQNIRTNWIVTKAHKKSTHMRWHCQVSSWAKRRAQNMRKFGSGKAVRKNMSTHIWKHRKLNPGQMTLQYAIYLSNRWKESHKMQATVKSRCDTSCLFRLFCAWINSWNILKIEHSCPVWHNTSYPSSMSHKQRVSETLGYITTLPASVSSPRINSTCVDASSPSGTIPSSSKTLHNNLDTPSSIAYLKAYSN